MQGFFSYNIIMRLREYFISKYNFYISTNVYKNAMGEAVVLIIIGRLNLLIYGFSIQYFFLFGLIGSLIQSGIYIFYTIMFFALFKHSMKSKEWKPFLGWSIYALFTLSQILESLNIELFSS